MRAGGALTADPKDSIGYFTLSHSAAPRVSIVRSEDKSVFPTPPKRDATYWTLVRVAATVPTCGDITLALETLAHETEADASKTDLVLPRQPETQQASSFLACCPPLEHRLEDCQLVACAYIGYKRKVIPKGAR